MDFEFRRRIGTALTGLLLGSTVGCMATLGASGLARFRTQSTQAASASSPSADAMPRGPVTIRLTRVGRSGRVGPPDYTVTIDSYGKVLLECSGGHVVYAPIRYEIGAARAYHLALLLYRSGFCDLEDFYGRQPARGGTEGHLLSGQKIAVTSLQIGELRKKIRHTGPGPSELDAVEDLIDAFAETEAHMPRPKPDVAWDCNR